MIRNSGRLCLRHPRWYQGSRLPHLAHRLLPIHSVGHPLLPRSTPCLRPRGRKHHEATLLCTLPCESRRVRRCRISNTRRGYAFLASAQHAGKLDTTIPLAPYVATPGAHERVASSPPEVGSTTVIGGRLTLLLRSMSGRTRPDKNIHITSGFVIRFVLRRGLVRYFTQLFWHSVYSAAAFIAGYGLHGLDSIHWPLTLYTLIEYEAHVVLQCKPLP